MGTEARARLGLVAALVAAVVSFGQVFVKADYFGPVLLGTLLAVAIAVTARRLGARSLLTFLVSAVGLLVYVVIVFQGARSYYGLPTPDALDHLTQSVSTALDHVQVDYEPVPVRNGYVILLVVGFWTAATIGEIAAFRWRRPLVASAGPLALFALATVVGDRDASPFVVTVFLTGLLTFWGLEASHRLRSWGKWIPTWPDSDEQPASLTGRIARRMGASCVVAALLAPAVLPALDKGLLAWRTGGEGNGPGGSGTIDYLVSIKPTLLEQSETELFRVDADRAAYWRLITLSVFDGTTWRPRPMPLTATSSGQFTAADIERDIKAANLSQRFELRGLEGRLLPAAATPYTVDLAGPSSGPDVVFNEETGDVGMQEPREGPVEYTVNSLATNVSFAELRRTPVENDSLLTVYDEDGLPSDLLRELRPIAERWTRNADSPAEKLIAIQERLRTFEYSTRVDPDTSGEGVIDFLMETRAGFCQQFATAFAALARSLDYPTRVVVGFLPGETSPAAPNRFLVRGTDAHAWPEVAFEDVGWVQFEPTPRDEAPLPRHTVPRASGVGPTEGTLPPGQTDRRLDGSIPWDRLGEQPIGRDPQSFEPGVDRADDGPPRWTANFYRLLRILAITLAVLLLAVPFVKLLRVRRRYARAIDDDAVARAAFAHFEDEAGELAARRSPSESAVTYARRIAAARSLSSKEAARLAAIVESAEYGPRPIDKDLAREARRLARRLRNGLWANASWWDRATRLFSPRGLLPGLLGRL